MKHSPPLQDEPRPPSLDEPERSEDEDVESQPLHFFSWIYRSILSKLIETRIEPTKEKAVELAREREKKLEEALEKVRASLGAADQGGGSASQESLIDTPELERAAWRLAWLEEQREEMLGDEVKLVDGWREVLAVTRLGWVVLIGLIICGVGSWAIYDIFQVRKEGVIKREMWLAGEQQREKLKAKVAEEAEVVKEAKDAQDTRDMLVDMQDCVRDYLAAGSVEAMIPLVRHPERVESLMKEYYKSHKRWRMKFKRFDKIRSVSMGSQSFVYILAVVEIGSSKPLMLEQLEDKSFRVDWESEVIYQPMPWSEYLLKRPLMPMDMRVKVQLDNFYGFAFRESERYQCYKLTSIGSDDHLFGYVERSSQVAKKIEGLLQRLAGKTPSEKDGSVKVDGGFEKVDESPSLDQFGGIGPFDVAEITQRPEPMILRIRFLRDDPSKRCVMIEALLAERWLYINSPE